MSQTKTAPDESELPPSRHRHTQKMLSQMVSALSEDDLAEEYSIHGLIGALEEFLKMHAVELNRGNLRAASSHLGLGRTTLLEWIKAHGLVQELALIRRVRQNRRWTRALFFQ